MERTRVGGTNKNEMTHKITFLLSLFKYMASESGAINTYLRLVARGNAVLAELKRLGKYIPGEFQWTDRKSKDARVLVDLSHLQSPNDLDARLHTDPVRYFTNSTHILITHRY